MSSWDSGYISELEYTYGYYRELSPGLLRLACLSAGVMPPLASPLNYLELGSGQGTSINIHAAAGTGAFWGVDYSPAQTAHARSLADAARSGAELLDQSFIELAARDDLPEFDVIALHGIWSWVSEDSRAAIVDIIRRRLRVGGIVYISYNCLPGWGPMLPLRHLLALHAELEGSGGSTILTKVDNAFAFAKSVIEAGPFYFRLFPSIADRLEAITRQDRVYVTHEYFNRNWDVMPFSDVVQRLQEAKLSYVAPAHLIDHVDAINLAAPWQKLLSGIENPVLRQTVRDLLVNQ